MGAQSGDFAQRVESVVTKFKTQTMKFFKLILFISLFTSSCTMLSKKNFDKAEWKKIPSERYKMVDDLVSSKILIGRTKDEVKEILTADCKYCHNTSNNWMYYLGEGFNKRDFKWEILDVEFKNNKVIRVLLRE
ncbi:MAG: hypothetical protein CFE24_02445 [Flavobacterium sp. BFFFF2]|nr:MAG: hypothetical protein CFE24_02445 [Flavobacterium sp. BFFFF2]